MQPYFLPYVGYFQLIGAVDAFILYDNIEYTKKGWINRNRMLVNGNDVYFTLPLKSDSDFLDVSKRFLASSFEVDKIKLIRKFSESYRKAPFYEQGMTLINDIFSSDERNLFNFIFQSLKKVCSYLELNTQFRISSTLDIDHELRAEDKVIAICKHECASVYINPVGGLNLYANERFFQNGIELIFLKPLPFEYSQFNNNFISWLSIIDVIMFNPKEKITSYISSGYEFIKNNNNDI
jgi:hypothetical protein